MLVSLTLRECFSKITTHEYISAEYHLKSYLDFYFCMYNIQLKDRLLQCCTQKYLTIS